MSLITPLPSGPRNGLPAARPYVYRGTGEDTLTGDMGTAQLREDIAAQEGEAFRPPLTLDGRAPYKAARP